MIAWLVRHGHTDAVGCWLAGQRADLPLSAKGGLEAEAVAAALRPWVITAIYSSPLMRALETARALARACHLTVQQRVTLTDVDFGAWTGRSLDSLHGNPQWEAFNRERDRACPPAGEPLRAVQQRVVDELIGLARVHHRAAGHVAIVTHAEPIRCALAALESKSLDEVRTIEISTAHVSMIEIGPSVRRVLSVNVSPSGLEALTARP